MVNILCDRMNLSIGIYPKIFHARKKDIYRAVQGFNS